MRLGLQGVAAGLSGYGKGLAGAGGSCCLYGGEVIGAGTGLGGAAGQFLLGGGGGAHPCDELRVLGHRGGSGPGQGGADIGGHERGGSREAVLGAVIGGCRLMSVGKVRAEGAEAVSAGQARDKSVGVGTGRASGSGAALAGDSAQGVQISQQCPPLDAAGHRIGPTSPLLLHDGFEAASGVAEERFCLPPGDQAGGRTGVSVLTGGRRA